MSIGGLHLMPVEGLLVVVVVVEVVATFLVAPLLSLLLLLLLLLLACHNKGLSRRISLMVAEGM